MINLAIKEILNEAEELIQSGNSQQISYGRGLMNASLKMQNDLPSCLVWGLMDFEDDEERMRDFFKVYNQHIIGEINELIEIHKIGYK
jgi:hypothetical protein